MALIRCKECGNNISDKSKACPNCGCPTAYSKISQPGCDEIESSYTERDKMRDAVIALVLMVLFGAVYFMIN